MAEICDAPQSINFFRLTLSGSVTSDLVALLGELLASALRGVPTIDTPRIKQWNKTWCVIKKYLLNIWADGSISWNNIHSDWGAESPRLFSDYICVHTKLERRR